MSEEDTERKLDYMLDWWIQFVDLLPKTEDWNLRYLGLKMIEEPLTPENLYKFLKYLEPSDYDLVLDDEKFYHKIRTHRETIIKNQEKITFEQFDELQKIFEKYKETKIW